MLKRALKVGAAALLVAIAATSLTGCAKETTATGEQTITIYSGRSEDLIAQLLSNSPLKPESASKFDTPIRLR